MELGIKNYMEDVVRNKIPVILSRMPEICACERCRLDILAFALNALPPRYVVTRQGNLYAKVNTLENQFDADLIRAITDAAVKINQKPRHDDEE